jgi:hypothetical protein
VPPFFASGKFVNFVAAYFAKSGRFSPAWAKSARSYALEYCPSASSPVGSVTCVSSAPISAAFWFIRWIVPCTPPLSWVTRAFTASLPEPRNIPSNSRSTL